MQLRASRRRFCFCRPWPASWSESSGALRTPCNYAWIAKPANATEGGMKMASTHLNYLWRSVGRWPPACRGRWRAGEAAWRSGQGQDGAGGSEARSSANGWTVGWDQERRRRVGCALEGKGSSAAEPDGPTGGAGNCLGPLGSRTEALRAGSSNSIEVWRREQRGGHRDVKYNGEDPCRQGYLYWHSQYRRGPRAGRETEEAAGRTKREGAEVCQWGRNEGR